MKAAAFAYHRPATLDGALQLLTELAPEDGRVLAGGQSLVPIMAFRLAQPRHLIDINRVAGLGELRVRTDGLAIPACVRHERFHLPVVDGPLGLLLSQVVRNIAHAPIRSRGTFCGSVAHADPASEWCLVTVTLGATMRAQSVAGERAIPAAEFFVSSMMTALQPGELLLEVHLPTLPSDTQFGFEEFSRRPGDYAMAMALATFRLVDGVMVEPRIGVGGAEDRPRRIASAEAKLQGRAPSEAAFAEAALTAARDIAPLVDLQTTAAYRRSLVQAMVRRALANAASHP